MAAADASRRRAAAVTAARAEASALRRAAADAARALATATASAAQRGRRDVVAGLTDAHATVRRVLALNEAMVDALACAVGGCGKKQEQDRPPGLSPNQPPRPASATSTASHDSSGALDAILTSMDGELAALEARAAAAQHG